MPTIYDDQDREQLRGQELNPGQAHYGRQIDQSNGAKSLGDLERGATSDGQSSVSSNGGSRFGNGRSTEEKGKQQSFASRLAGRAKNRFNNLSKVKKAFAAGSFGVGLLGLIFGGFSLFGFLNVFRLDHFYKNIEAKSFIRYQVDMDNRSSKWINAYITLRMGEVENDNIAPQDRDNILFRADRVDNNQPWFDWYRTMRSSNFEDRLAEQGIRFTSSARWDPTLQRTVFRPGVITRNNQPIPMDLSPERIQALSTINPNGLNNDLINYFDVQLFGDENGQGGDREARAEIRRVIKENTAWYQVMQRYYWRKSIQNQIGVRDWRFFDKTRTKVSDATISARNKFIVRSFPETAKSGKFVQCFFGVGSCPRSTDPSDPENQSDSSLAGLDCNSEPKPDGCTPEVNDRDETPDVESPQVPSGEAEAGVRDGVNVGEIGLPDTGGAGAAGAFTRKITQQIISKVSGPLSVVSFVDTINTMNKLIKDSVLTKGVYNARMAQAVAAFATVGTAASQAHTGELTSEEMGGLMTFVDGASSSEGWNKVIADRNPITAGTASAESYEQARNKDTACSEDHQTAMLLPENAKKAASEYQWLCDSQKIGAASNAKTIEKSWTTATQPVQPILAAYDASGLDSVLGAVNGAISAVTGPIMEATIKGLGLDDNVESVMAFFVTRAVGFLGGGPMLDTNSPGGQVVNQAISGATASSESIARFQGAAATTDLARAKSERAVAAYNGQKQSVIERYASLGNPNSLLSSGLFAATTTKPSTGITSFFSSIASVPNKLLSSPAHAANETGYEVSKFAGVETYDFPTQCTDREILSSVTPAELTNADELGLIGADEVTWDLISDSSAFYGKLYADNSDNSDAIKTVYNCALMDSAVSSALGALYGVDLGPNALEEPGSATAATGTPDVSFKIASFNIYYSTNQNDSAYSIQQWQDRLKNSSKVIKDNAVQVAGLQEVRENQWGALLNEENLGSNYAVYPDNYQAGGYASQNPIVWDKTRFELVEGKTIDGPHVTEGGYYPNSNTQVKLKDIATGQQFYFINTHEPVGKGASIDGRYNSALKRLEYVKNLSSDDTPVFLTGDYNSGYDLRAAQPTKGNKRDNIAYCILTKDGVLWDAKDAVNGTAADGKCPPTKTGAVDHIFMSTKVKTTSYDESNKPKGNGSDVHNTIIANVTIPGTAATALEGSDQLTVGTYNIKHEINFGGACKLNECAEKRSQLQADIISGTKGGTTYDIVTLQEVSVPQNDRLKKMLGSYSSWPAQVPSNRGTAIFWNSSKFSKIEDGTIDAIDNAGDPIKLPWVGLQTASGQKIYVLSIHSPNDHSGGSPQKRAQNAKTYLAWAKSIKSKGGIAIVGGDFNRNLKNNGNPIDGAYCIMTAGGNLQNAYDMAASKNPDTTCPSKNEDKGIDHIYISPQDSVSASNWVHEPRTGSFRTASDHEPVHVTLELAGAAGTGTGSGSTGGWVWPFSKNDYMGPFGSNTWGNRFCGGSCGLHGGIDISGVGGKTAVAAHSGTVVKIDNSSTCKLSVLIQATGTGVWYGYQHMSSINVKVGQQVTAGTTPIGVVYSGGSTGCIQGPHLHMSIEKKAAISAYADANLSCDVSDINCAKQMPSLPPLCFLDKEDRNYGSSVSPNEIKGSGYCNQLLAGIGG